MSRKEKPKLSNLSNTNKEKLMSQSWQGKRNSLGLKTFHNGSPFYKLIIVMKR
jgi:hypothetical protein